ncbi:hypothetical protein DK419_16430 [Methylobacterium terrae]|uniref:Uncharacterized protein n=1 Tax=Methylobacterium terrae TaxID=2202827 RepID=A0A2U8WN66_9HYPH|nr:hypothetical protein [Methylobacterium terrae]AWN47705.1 hypothetical protein DK419_16430 [Methylobacterium terrae]
MADDPSRDTRRETKISNGPNARPRDETIAQTGPGLPNDSSAPVEIDEEEARRIEDRIRAS